MEVNMRARDVGTRYVAALVCAALAACRTGETGAERAHIAFAHALPKLNGDLLEATIVEVTYGPGGGSSPHSHPCPVIGYVVEGAYRTQLRGEPAAVYTAGQTFYEAPNSAHVVSANA